jgi:superfamily I DNA and RNA helicase
MSKEQLSLEQKIDNIFNDVTTINTIDLHSKDELVIIDTQYNELSALLQIKLKKAKAQVLTQQAKLDVDIRQNSSEKLTEAKILNLITVEPTMVLAQKTLLELENSSIKLNAVKNILTTYITLFHTQD